jgi:predicted RNase H-like nuclease (RuvC/YqgF family)
MREQLRRPEALRGMPFAEQARALRETRALVEAQQREIKGLKDGLARQQRELQQLRKELAQMRPKAERQPDHGDAHRKHGDRPERKDDEKKD